jgi:putative copper resistance protein D
LYATLVVFHVLAAAVWIGGTVALVFAGIPVLRQLPDEQRAHSVRALGRRWRPIGWGALAVLLASGVWLAFGYWGADDPDVLFKTEDGHILIAKALLFLTLVTSVALHDFVLGPRLNRQIREGRPRTLLRPMQVAGWWSFAATVTLPILGVVLST